MITFPNAKINIGLRVVSRRPDGYHNIETLFYPISLADVLEIVPASASATTLSVTGFAPAGDVADDAEQWGPIPAMVLATRRVYENGALARQSSVVVTGSVSMLENLCLQNSSLSNSSYLLNLFNTLTEREETVTIAPKSLAGKTLGITTAQVTTLGMVLGGLLPLAILGTGIGIWLYRRYK